MVRVDELSDAEIAHVRRAYELTQASDGMIDGGTARWADAFAQSVADWCKKHRSQGAALRAPEIAKVLTQYMGLSRTVDEVERVTGVKFH